MALRSTKKVPYTTEPEGSAEELAERIPAEVWAQFGIAHAISPRELAVAKGWFADLKPAALARRLRCRPSTIKTHVKSLYRKIHVHDRTQFLVAAIFFWQRTPLCANND